MGARAEFKCPGCGYSAMVSGGEDGGMEVSTTTISCVECQELYDVVSGRIVFADTADATLNPETIRCHKDAEHQIREWQANGPCPRCQTQMNRGEDYVLWD